MAFDVEDYLQGQLAFLRRRATPEERARIEWWKRRIELLAEQEPKADPVKEVKQEAVA